MAADAKWVVVLDDAVWQVARIETESTDISDSQNYERNNLADVAEAIFQCADELTYRGEPVLLALGSSWCVNARLAVPTPKCARKRQTMTYLLEPHLPWAAEKVVVDYELTGTNAFMVAAEAEPLADMIDRLEGRGMRVDSIAPLARLALADSLSGNHHSAERSILLWGHDEVIELWLVENHRPLEWQWLPADANTVLRTIHQLELSESNSLPIVTRDLPTDIAQELAARSTLDLKQVENPESVSYLEAGLREASAVLDGRHDATIEFRRDLLAAGDRYRSVGRHIHAVQLAMLLLFAFVGVAFLLKTYQNDALRKTLGDQQMDVYRHVFPGRREQVGVKTLLENELVRLRGVRGDHTGLPESVASLALLERLLKSLPDDFRFRLLEIRADKGQLYLVGEVRAHGDADRIAEALRKFDLKVSSPSTRQLQLRGVEFRISAQLDTPTEKDLGGKT